MRAKFGINDMESVGEIGNFCRTIEGASAGHGKVSDNAGMKCPKSVEFPKPDVAGLIPVARSIFINHLTIFRFRRKATRRPRSFGVRSDGVEHVGVSLDRKIKTPPSIYAGLPDIVGLVVFFGSQGRMAQVLEQKGKFPIKELLDVAGSVTVGLDKLRGSPNSH